MYSTLIVFHSLFRWLLLTGLIVSIFKAYQGLSKQKKFTKLDNSIRHWTATIAHIQLMIGMFIYFKSPIVASFFKSSATITYSNEPLFFSIIHISIMFIAIIVLTIGSAKAKREKLDHHKFRTMLYWYIAAFVLIMIAIPWPFSPLAARPLLRNF